MERANSPTRIAVRDSKAPARATLVLPAEAFAPFLRSPQVESPPSLTVPAVPSELQRLHRPWPERHRVAEDARLLVAVAPPVQVGVHLERSGGRVDAHVVRDAHGRTVGRLLVVVVARVGRRSARRCASSTGNATAGWRPSGEYKGSEDGVAGRDRWRCSAGRSAVRAGGFPRLSAGCGLDVCDAGAPVRAPGSTHRPEVVNTSATTVLVWLI
ncbi:DUF397 domain-containing protein [Streptomyces hirsutus]|uniref:DUF397 domain-containing protein n=1 Tax=Streptomyces hirsutus TaxID=35620 RepID=UPI003F4D1459